MSPRSARYAQLIKVCRARGFSLDDAKDVVQEAHLRLFEYQRSAQVRDADSILRRIVINISINHYHRGRSTALVSDTIDQLDRLGALIDPAAGPEQTLAAKQELDRVAHWLRAEGPRACQIFIAQRAGYSYEEIAAAFYLKPRTVEKHVAAAAALLYKLEDLTP